MHNVLKHMQRIESLRLDIVSRDAALVAHGYLVRSGPRDALFHERWKARAIVRHVPGQISCVDIDVQCGSGPWRRFETASLQVAMEYRRVALEERGYEAP